MDRIAIVAAIAIAIFWNSDCLTIQGGKIVNRCGLWQWVTNSSLVLLVENKKVEQPSYEAKRAEDNWKQVQDKINGSVKITPSFSTYPISSAIITSVMTPSSITYGYCNSVPTSTNIICMTGNK